MSTERTTVPPEVGSPFGEAIDPAGGFDGYWTYEHLVTEVMARLGLSKPDAEDYVDEYGAGTSIEAVREVWA